MNGRAKWSIIRLSSIDSASCQVVLRDSGSSSIGRGKVFKFGVSISTSKQSNGKISGNWGERMIRGQLLQAGFWSIRKELGKARLTGRSSESRSLRLAMRNCDMCSVHTWRVGMSKLAFLHFLRETKYHGLYMLSIRSW